MRIEGLGLNNEEVLDRICEAYGFSQKIQLAEHFEIASSSLANRYSRDSISYDFIVHCALKLAQISLGYSQAKGHLQPAI